MLCTTASAIEVQQNEVLTAQEVVQAVGEAIAQIAEEPAVKHGIVTVDILNVRRDTYTGTENENSFIRYKSRNIVRE